MTLPAHIVSFIEDSLKPALVEGVEDERLWAEMDRFPTRVSWEQSALEAEADREAGEGSW